MLYHDTAVNTRQPPGVASRAMFIVLALSLSACSNTTTHTDALARIAPLQFDGHAIAVEDVANIAPTPDLLALDDDMRAFVKTYTGRLRSDRQRIHELHQSIKSNAILGVKYAADACR